MSIERDQAITGPDIVSERMFRFAERASEPAGFFVRNTAHNPIYEPCELVRLVELAECELERRSKRSRFLPAGICSDLGWQILLDVFVASYQKEPVLLEGAGERWKEREENALRHIAGLIAHGLVRRMPCEELGGRITLELTEYGHDALGETLRLLDSSE